MCRMIMALGKIDPLQILEAAILMSEGKTAATANQIQCHPNGWGMVWNEKDTAGLSVFRHQEPISQSIVHAPAALNTSFLAVHVRHATLPHTLGLNFTHPVTADYTEVPWYMFHNGFLPTAYEQIGLESSSFDSQEYFNYIIPAKGDRLDKDDIIKKLHLLKPVGTSANAIIINEKRVYVVNWSMSSVSSNPYYALYKTTVGDALYIASEIQPLIAGASQWQKMVPSIVEEYSLENVYATTNAETV